MPLVLRAEFDSGRAAGVAAAKPSISFDEAMELSKKARVLKFGNLPVDEELQKGLASFLNELYKALKLNTVGGDSCISATLDADARTALVEFRTVKEAAAAKTHLSGVEYGKDNKLTVETPEGSGELTPEARFLSVLPGLLAHVDVASWCKAPGCCRARLPATATLTDA